MLSEERKEELIRLTRDLVAQRSASGHEDGAAGVLEQYLRNHGFDQVTVDELGNVIGRLAGSRRRLLNKGSHPLGEWFPLFNKRSRRTSGGGAFSSAAAGAAALLSTLDAGLAAGHGHAIADRYGHTDLLLEGQRAAGAAAVGGAGDAGAALAGHRGRPHDGGGIQRQRRGDIHALGGHFIAAGGRTGLLHRAGLERRMLIDFVDAQGCSLIS